MKKNLVIGGVALALLLVSIKFFPYHCNCQLRTAGVARTTPIAGRHVVIGQTSIAVDIADTPALREQGLSGRTSLCAGCGMLFIFPNAGTYGFWMKDMNFSLDIVWVGANHKIVGVEENLPPTSYPQIVYPSAPVLYVLELPAGTYKRQGFSVGEGVEILN